MINFIYRGDTMSKTVIDLNDSYIESARKLTGLKKKIDIVNFALEKLVKQKEIEGILKLKGKINWSGNLENMRRDREIDFSR